MNHPQFSTRQTQLIGLSLPSFRRDTTIQPQQNQNDDAAKETTILNILPMLLTAIFARYIPIFFVWPKGASGTKCKQAKQKRQLRANNIVEGYTHSDRYIYIYISIYRGKGRKQLLPRDGEYFIIFCVMKSHLLGLNEIFLQLPNAWRAELLFI